MNEPDIGQPVPRGDFDCDLFSSLLILWHRRHGFLMQLRSWDAPVMPSCVGFFGGGIQPDESPLAAAQRELHEELALTCHDLGYAGRRIAEVEPDHRELAFFFSTELSGDHYIAYEGSGTVWVDPLRPPAGLYPRDLATLHAFRAERVVSRTVGHGA
jgi:8-oxo-dGTP pyrophosphatase MutT (NUDIX family)